MSIAESTRASPDIYRFCLLASLGLAILIIDQFSKYLVFNYLPLIDSTYYWYPYGGIGIFKNFLGIEFSINHVTNTGAAWGVLGNYQLFLIVLRLGLISGLCIYLVFFNTHRLWQIPLTLIIVGAIGNVFDFFLYRHVIDMFHFILWGYDFPVFNVADSAISLGIGSLFLVSWMRD